MLALQFDSNYYNIKIKTTSAFDFLTETQVRRCVFVVVNASEEMEENLKTRFSRGNLKLSGHCLF